MTNQHHTVLYTGVTSDLAVRVLQHKEQKYSGSFTARYRIHKLVYYQFFSTIEEAISEEKRIKAGNRQKKLRLITSLNPLWEDLWQKEVSKW